MKKTNKKGFTLVELVVVVAIFGVILGAILNFIKPANDIHNDVQATRDANIISSGIIEYIDDELRYATNILVLEDYQGVPNVSETGQVGDCAIPFTNCLVLDNVNFRGYCLNDYSGSDNDTAAKRMGATGCVIKVNKLAEGGFNFKNSSVVMGVDFYDKFKYNFSIGTNSFETKHTDKLKTLQVNVVTLEAVYHNGHYEFEKKKFDRDTVYSSDEAKKKTTGAIINLTNINIDNNDDFDLRGDFQCADSFAEHLCEDHYPNATAAPSGATSYQQKYYVKSDENRYTYVFYQKNTGASASECEVKLVYANDHPTVSLQGKQIGSTTTVTKGNVFKSFPSAANIPGYLPPQWLDPSGNVVDTSAGYKINGNTTFTLSYTPEAALPQHQVTWLKPDGSEWTKNNAFEGHNANDPGTPPGVDTTKQDFLGWFRQGSDQPLSAVIINGDGYVFYPKVKDKWKVEFCDDEAGANINASKTSYVSDGQTAIAPDETPAPPAATKIFDKWVVKGHTDQELTTHAVTANTVFVPVFKDKPSDISGWNITYTASDTGKANHWDPSVPPWGANVDYATNYKIALTFKTSKTGKWVSDYRIKITLDKSGTIENSGDFKAISGNGSSSITLTLAQGSQGQYNPIGNNDSRDFTIRLMNSTVKVDKVELLSVNETNRSWY